MLKRINQLLSKFQKDKKNLSDMIRDDLIWARLSVEENYKISYGTDFRVDFYSEDANTHYIIMQEKGFSYKPKAEVVKEIIKTWGINGQINHRKNILVADAYKEGNEVKYETIEIRAKQQKKEKPKETSLDQEILCLTIEELGVIREIVSKNYISKQKNNPNKAIVQVYEYMKNRFKTHFNHVLFLSEEKTRLGSYEKAVNFFQKRPVIGVNEFDDKRLFSDGIDDFSFHLSLFQPEDDYRGSMAVIFDLNQNIAYYSLKNKVYKYDFNLNKKKEILGLPGVYPKIEHNFNNIKVLKLTMPQNYVTKNKVLIDTLYNSFGEPIRKSTGLSMMEILNYREKTDIVIAPYGNYLNYAAPKIITESDVDMMTLHATENKIILEPYKIKFKNENFPVVLIAKDAELKDDFRVKLQNGYIKTLDEFNK